jgi:hypothetical protein
MQSVCPQGALTTLSLNNVFATAEPCTHAVFLQALGSTDLTLQQLSAPTQHDAEGPWGQQGDAQDALPYIRDEVEDASSN